MKTVGIAAEYNPFHRGHACQLSACRRMLGEDAVFAAVMSGDFVQRGEAAMFSKFARAEAACRAGADLVVELPLPWSLASAEGMYEASGSSCPLPSRRTASGRSGRPLCRMAFRYSTARMQLGCCRAGSFLPSSSSAKA